MGETAADTQQEVEAARQRLDQTVLELRQRAPSLPGRRGAGIAVAGVAALAGGAVVALRLLRSRRSEGPFSRGLSRAPAVVARRGRPAARGLDRALDAALRRRREAVDNARGRLARDIVHEQKQADPVGKRLVVTAATSAIGAAVPRAVSRLVAAPPAAGARDGRERP